MTSPSVSATPTSPSVSATPSPGPNIHGYGHAGPPLLGDDELFVGEGATSWGYGETGHMHEVAGNGVVRCKECRDSVDWWTASEPPDGPNRHSGGGMDLLLPKRLAVTLHVPRDLERKLFSANLATPSAMGDIIRRKLRLVWIDD